ncbi:methyl-accepting chemotaxis protein [Chitinilyticum piscinae]|uniref:Methyl-accepting chemotaxis protein n=1 Tax=Chitinilyticum piscinae TaxID=2866724 RepID=A0A8J7FPI8_9NEIS|nr:methyl-accepting chemotaxis protein [Chitinilyticum piscinae]MBE9608211.1 hypothetical protein [Chitinilyticum piscinae]
MSLFNPATRLLDRLSYPRKFLLVSGVFLVPLLLCLSFVWQAAMSDIQFAERERAGVSLIRLAMDVLAESAQGRLASSDALEKAGELHHELGTTEVMAAVQQARTPEGQFAALQNLISVANDHSNLILDPEIASYYTGDMIVGRLPAVLALLAASNRKEASLTERLSLPDGLTAQLAGMQLALDKASAEHASVAALGKELAQLQSASKTLLEHYRQQISTPLEQGAAANPADPALNSAREAAMRSAAELISPGLSTLDDLLAKRIQQRWERLGLVLAISMAAVLLAAWLLAGFYFGTRRNLAVLRSSLGEISAGQFRLSQQLNGMDELAAVQPDLQQMSEMLQRFMREQLSMAKEHENGNIHATMPLDCFVGGYREMADQVNDLVRSHTAIEMKMAALTSMYTQGEFELQIDSMQGLKALISSEVEKVRERMAEAAEMASFTRRIKEALDQVTTPILITNDDGIVIYSNHAGTSRFTAELQRNQQRLTGLLASSNATIHPGQTLQRGEAQLGALLYSIVLTPVQDEQGKLIGHVAEFTDHTEATQTASEISRAISAAARGDFQHRIALDNKSGFFAEMSGQVNQLLDAVQLSLDDFTKALALLAEGDLTVRMRGHYQGTFAELAGSTNTTAGQLQHIIGSIREAAESVAATSAALKQGAQGLQSLASQQAAATEETAATSNNLNEMVAMNSKQARLAAGSANAARQEAVAGLQAMSEVQQAMKALTQSAGKISEITSLIDGIAFQTNILALNAAVEAARAGEAGRGFAVVAAEVRSLAQKSASASHEIRELVQGSVSQIHAGDQLVGTAAGQSKRVDHQIGELASSLAEIAQSSEQQRNSVGEISAAMRSLDSTGQKNLQLCETMSQHALAMQNAAEHLSESVSVFKTT